ncbi:MAG: PstS family phosphate ABC transporter substrate-binding protein [Gemmataceae bacterium]|nr:PstS family phosphate ABC transporter substrate-binding protein [Gemmataceae bacterium]
MKVAFLSVGTALTLAAAGSSLAAGDDKLVGSIKADGSSTVYLITEAMASKFTKLHPGVKISVAFSGTGGGFKKFASGETDIANASRPIKPAEAEKCRENGITFTELQVAWDGLAVVIHPENTWAKRLTVEQLRKIWHPDSKPTNWSDVDPTWPKQPIKLYGAGSDSGTFDYFTEVVNGKEKVIRTDYTPAEDDNITVQGVARNQYAIGFFGVAYFEQNRSKLAVVEVMNPKTKQYVAPTPEAVIKGEYLPLSRPLFIYVKNSSLKRPEVREFVRYYLQNSEIVRSSGYVPMSSVQAFQQRKRLDAALKTLD